MSETENKTEDKKEIEDEEREKMLNEENKKDAEEINIEEPDEVKVMIEPEKKEEGEVMKMRKALEESEKEKDGKKKIPIGGIKIPGFLRSRSREKAKDEDLEEDKDLLHEPPCIATNVQEKSDKDQTSTDSGKRRLHIPSVIIRNPFFRKTKEQADGGAQEDGDQTDGKRVGILNSIRLPIVTELSRRFKHKEKDAELGQAGLASMETLDDSTDMKSADDGMENVKLDNTEEKNELEDEEKAGTVKERFVNQFQTHLYRRRWWICIFIFLILIIVVVFMVGMSSGNSGPIRRPLINGRYIETVTSCGPVQGILEKGIFIFRGIPYASPPVSEMRFSPAKIQQHITKCWNGTYLAYNSTSCMHLLPNETIVGVEDCLHLDIHTPSVSYENPLPVIVLIAADTIAGGLSEPLSVSPWIIKNKNVVYVVPNFRFGALGFLASKSLTRSVHPPSSGNYGLTDLVAALEWINLNIVHFNGDKSDVTLLGHRAGGTLVTVLTASYPAKNLFHKAWISSASSIFPGRELREAEKDFEGYVESLNCGSEPVEECLKKLSAKKLIGRTPEDWLEPKADLPFEETPHSHTWLVQDGYIIRNHLLDEWKENNSSIKIVMGSTLHSDIPRHLHTDITTDTSFDVSGHIRKSLLGSKGLADDAIRRYTSTAAGLISMISDIQTVCPLLNLSRMGENILFYVVTQPRENGKLLLADMRSDIVTFLNQCNFKDEKYQKYCVMMQGIFYDFVNTGKFIKKSTYMGKENRGIILVDPTENPSLHYPNCDSWFSYGIVPKYSRVD